jgi:hypothetical protein
MIVEHFQSYNRCVVYEEDNCWVSIHETSYDHLKTKNKKWFPQLKADIVHHKRPTDRKKFVGSFVKPHPSGVYYKKILSEASVRLS